MIDLLVIIGNLKFEAYLRCYTHFGWLIRLRTFKGPSLFVPGHHCLALVTIDLVGDDREYEV